MEGDKRPKAKQPYAIAMKDGSPFGIAGIWENWKDPSTGEWVRTFAIITTDANPLIAEIHDRMPAILPPSAYTRWLSDEPDPRDLLTPFPSEPMRIWAISTRVNKPENDDASILEPVELTGAGAVFACSCSLAGVMRGALRPTISVLTDPG
jgi:putative SOS response-associated peptidase YedK